MINVIVLLVCFASLWSCVLYLVPQLVDSLFRYRLWKVRDDLQAYIFDECLPDSLAVNELLDFLEETIKHSSSTTLFKITIFRVLWKPSKRVESNRFDFSDLSESQQELVNALMYEFYLSFTFKIWAGSPVGAFFLPFWLIYYKNRRSGLIHQTIEIKRLRQFRQALSHNKSEPKDLVASVG